MRIYRDIIKTAWTILWRYPWLWVFGLLVSLAGVGTELNSVASVAQRMQNQANFLESMRGLANNNQFSAYLTDLIGSLSNQPALLGATIALFLAILLLVFWLVAVSQAGLISATKNIADGQSTSLYSSIKTGHQHFWAILVLNIITRFATYLVMAMAILPFLILFLAQTDAGWSFNVVMGISFIVAVPIALIISFIIKYATMYVVLDGESWWMGLDRAISLFFRNWLVSLEMAGLMLVASLAVNFILFILIPSTFGIQVAIFLNNATVISFLTLLPTLGLVMASMAWFGTFQYVAWTLLFKKLQSGLVVAKLHRLTSDIPIYIANWITKQTIVMPTGTTKSKKR